MCAYVGLCVQERRPEEEGVYVYAFVSESLICAPMYGSLPRGQGRTAQGGRHLTGYRWQRQTDRDIGDINTLINNYLNNDTGHTGGEGGGCGREGGHRGRNRKMRTRFEKARI